MLSHPRKRIDMGVEFLFIHNVGDKNKNPG